MEGTIFAGLRLFEDTFVDEEGVEQKVVGCGSDMNSFMLAKSTRNGSDGTYKPRSSKHFKQLYIFHGQIAPESKGPIEDDAFVKQRNCMRPLVYVFTTCKTKQSYMFILRRLKEVIAEKYDGLVWEGPES